MAMGDYGWSMNSDAPQGIDAVEYGRVLEYPKKSSTPLVGIIIYYNKRMRKSQPQIWICWG